MATSAAPLEATSTNSGWPLKFSFSSRISEMRKNSIAYILIWGTFHFKYCQQ